jgi:hypothetical protein
MFLARSMVWPTSHGAMACSQCVSCHLDTPAGQRPALSSFNPSQAAVRTFSTTSRPALRAAACGGRPRPADPPRGSLAPERNRLRERIDGESTPAFTQLASDCAGNRTSRRGVPVASYPTRIATAYAPGPPWTEVHWGPPGPWKNVVGLTTSYTLALAVGALMAGLVLSISLIPKDRHRQS